MTLSNDNILEIIQKRPNRNLIEFGTDQRKRSRMHMYGVGMNEHLTMIEGFEKPWLKQLRTKYVQSNKDLFSRLSKPLNKIFTARGGSTYYNLDGKKGDIAAIIDSNVQNGMSVKKWMETFWKYHMLDDPMGLIYIEIDSNGKAYPTYKCIDDIFDYQLSGDNVEYVIFRISNNDKLKLGLKNEDVVYRVVDDMFDKIIIIKSNEVIEEVPEQTFANYFGKVPGITNSPFINPDGVGFISPFYWIFDIADQHLLKISIRITHEFRHGFPKYYEFADDCIECKGTGKIAGKKHDECKGTGKKIMLNVSDAKLLEYPTKDAPGIKGAPGGYIEPSEIFWKIISTSLGELEDKINQTIWGSKSTTKLKNGMGLSAAPNGTVTATEVMDNRQPEVDCLNLFSDAAEARDKFISDCVIMIGTKDYSYFNNGGCSKNYGRRFLIEEPDALLMRYIDARKNGISPNILYGMYEQYLEAKYQSDGISLSLHKKLLKVEPFMHYTLAEVKENIGDPEAIRKKTYYGEWLAQMNMNTLILAPVDQLQREFESYVNKKPLMKMEEEKEEKPATAA